MIKVKKPLITSVQDFSFGEHTEKRIEQINADICKELKESHSSYLKGRKLKGNYAIGIK